MKPNRFQKISLILSAFVLALSACSSKGSSTPTSTSTLAIASTDTPAATSTAAPAAYPAPAIAGKNTPAAISQAYPAPAGKATAVPSLAPRDTAAATAVPTVVPTMAPTGTPLPSPTVAVPPTAIPQPTTAVTSTLAAGDAKMALVAAFTRLQTAFPFRVTETGNLITGSSNAIRVTELADAQTSHSVITQTNEVDEEIVIGTKVYLRINGGTWMAGTQSPNSAANLAAMLTAGLTEVKYVGTDKINGKDMLKFSFTASILGSTGSGTVWIGTEDGLPYRLEISSPYQGVTLTGTLVYQYGIKVTIKAPIP